MKKKIILDSSLGRQKGILVWERKGGGGVEVEVMLLGMADELDKTK